jgi:hypothetical protein
MQMMTVLTGRERSESQFATLLAGAGFAWRGVRATRSPFRIVEGEAAIHGPQT